METVAFLFHDGSGDEIGRFDLKAGDDAQALRWQDIGQEASFKKISHDKKCEVLFFQVQLYASHAEFIKLAAEKLGAHW